VRGRKKAKERRPGNAILIRNDILHLRDLEKGPNRDKELVQPFGPSILKTRTIYFETTMKIGCRIMRECVESLLTKNDLTEAMLQQSTAFLLHASLIVYDHELLSSESME
jgi:hypothetical protein